MTLEEAVERARAILVPLEDAHAAGTLEREAWIAAWHELEALSDVAPGSLEALFPLATDEAWLEAVGAGWTARRGRATASATHPRHRRPAR